MRRTVSKEPPPYRQSSATSAGGVVLALIAFTFTGWMLAQGHSPVVSVATASGIMTVATTLSRGRILGFKPVFWHEDSR